MDGIWLRRRRRSSGTMTLDHRSQIEQVGANRHDGGKIGAMASDRP
jgi:hypothetical protein